MEKTHFSVSGGGGAFSVGRKEHTLQRADILVAFRKPNSIR